MKKWTVDKKIMIFGVVIVAVTLVSFVAIVSSMSALNKASDELLEVEEGMVSFYIGYKDLHRRTSDIVQAIATNDKGHFDIDQDGDMEKSQLSKWIKELNQNTDPKIIEFTKALDTSAKNYFGHVNKIYRLIEADKHKEAFDKFNEEFHPAIEELYTVYDQLQLVYTSKKEQKIKETKNFVFAVKTASIVLGVIVILFFIVATGYLMKSLKAVAGRLVQSVVNVTSGSNEISKGNQDLSSRTQEQASSLEETASTIEEITSTVKQTADNSQKTTQLAQHAVSSAQEGEGLSEKAKKAMAEISLSSNKIAEIVNLVNEIAFQTNILAINAAIEAAKAGEQGKGFAVVAIEVRSLAQRSAEAAKEIKGLIMESIDKVTGGSHLVEETALKLKEIAQGIQQVFDLVNEISSASKEQYNAIEQINKAINELDSVTQQNSALVEEIASASENMSAEAEDMNKIVRENFTVKNIGQEQSGHELSDKQPSEENA